MEGMESDDGTHFHKNLVESWMMALSGCVTSLVMHQPPGKKKRYNGLLKTTLRALGGGTF